MLSWSKLIRACKGLLSQLAWREVFAEVKRIQLSPSAYQGIVDLYEYGISAVVLPEVDKAPNQAAVGISVCQPDLATRLGVLLGITETDADILKLRFNLPVSLAKEVE